MPKSLRYGSGPSLLKSNEARYQEANASAAFHTRQPFACDTGERPVYNAQRMSIRVEIGRRSCRSALLVVLGCCSVVGAANWALPFGAWHRASQKPILSPQGNGWESAGTFNPT